MLKNEIMEIISENLNLRPNALTIVEKRYLRKDEDGHIIETPEEMIYRVAHHIARAENNYRSTKKAKAEIEKAFAEMMAKFEFLPNSPTFTGAGTKLGQLAACFVLPVEDDMYAIMETLKNTVMIHKSGGGTGFSFSRLRPNGYQVGSSGGVASGPVSFMRMYNAATEEVKQGGTRRGANMGILRVDHPDILEFIDAKKDNERLNNFNLSVGITDDFMKKVKANQDYELLDPHTKKVSSTLNAKDVFKKIIDGAWNNGEPGVVFIDRINSKNPTPEIGEIESTNPCGEQPLLPYESCNLGSINLAKMIKDGKIDFDRLEQVIRLAIRFLDDVIDMNKFPLTAIEKMTKSNRKIGLGVMGFADMIIELGIAYDSEEGVETAEKIMKFIRDIARDTSQELAKTRGAFTNFKGSIYDKKGAKPMRNATVTTIAPTGTISMIAGTSSGIEPLFALVFTKNILDDAKLLEIDPLFEKIARSDGFFSEELMEKIAETGMVKDIEEIPAKWRRVFVTSREINPDWHVRMQVAFQKYTDNAVSKTINFPNSATKSEVEKAYTLAFDSGLKGLTVYRDGSRDVQVVDFGKKKEKKEETPKFGNGIHMEPRPDIMHGYTYKTKTSYGNLYITINEDTDNQPFEVFTNIGKAGGFFSANTEAISRLISLALRSGLKPDEIIDQLKGIRDPAPTWTKDGIILSLPDAIAKILKKHLELKKEMPTLPLNLPPKKDKIELVKEEPKKENHDEEAINQAVLIKEMEPAQKQISLADTGEAPICLECGTTLVFQEGCFKCPACGFSKCA
jgi:ribonucleoside-diphosphate reductase alpha chain